MPAEVTQSEPRSQRMLLCRQQVCDELEIDENRLEEFIESNLLTEVRIRGHLRFDSDEVDQIGFPESTPRSRGGAPSFLRSFRRSRANR